jgi:hypothetical protein
VSWNEELLTLLSASVRYKAARDLETAVDAMMDRSGPDRTSDDWDEEAWVGQIVAGLRRGIESLAGAFGFDSGLCHTPRLALVSSGTAESPGWTPMVSVVPADARRFAEAHNVLPRDLSDFTAAGVVPTHVLWSLIGPTGWRSDPLPVEATRLPVMKGDEFGDERDDRIDASRTAPSIVATDLVDVSVETLSVILEREDTAESSSGLQSLFDGDRFLPTEAVEARLTSVSRRATQMLQSLTGYPWTLRAQLAHPSDWLDGPFLTWFGTDPYGQELPIEQLGAGSRRWAQLAISATIAWEYKAVPHTIIVDEPERALHSAAQRQVAEAIVDTLDRYEIGEMNVVASVVASHSPAFLSAPSARLVHVSRGHDRSVRLDAIDLTIGIEALTAQLGVHRSELLLTTRWFVFVEGEHDRAVVNAVFADELRQAHAIVETMEGAKNVEPYVTAKYLLAYSDASIRVVLDAVGSKASEAWEAARAAADTGDAKAARRALERISRLPQKEAMWLYEAGCAALDRGGLSRVYVVGLERPDIINYLPVQAIVPGARSWEDLASEWRANRNSRSFKQWLRSAKGATFTTNTLRDVAEQLVERADLERIVHGL